MFFIIWGFRVRTKTVSSGTFACPGCNTARAYELKRMKRWFTLYFLPIFPVKALLEYVECGGCHQAWKLSVLDTEPVAAALAPAAAGAA